MSTPEQSSTGDTAIRTRDIHVGLVGTEDTLWY